MANIQLAMKCLLLLWCAAALQAGFAGGGSCAGPVLRGVHYTDEVLNPDHGARTLDYDIKSNILYFTTYGGLFKMDLNKRDPKGLVRRFFNMFQYSMPIRRIEDWNNGSWGAALDPQTGDFYVGSRNGVYKYDNATNKMKYFGASDSNMLDLFLTDIVYFVKWPSSQVYTIVDGHVSILEDLKNTVVRHLVIDDDNTIIFSNFSGLFHKKMGAEDAVLYEGTRNWDVMDLHLDMYGDVYVILDDGIYAVNRQTHQVETILSVVDCRSIAFDNKNNIIYSKGFSIHRLLRSDDQDCV